MATRAMRRYVLQEPESLTDEQSTIAESAVLEVSPTSNDGETVLEVAAIAELPTGREKAVIGYFDQETAREFQNELDAILQDL